MQWLKMNRVIVLWSHGRGIVTGPIKLSSLKHFQCIRNKMKTLSALGIKYIKHSFYGLLSLFSEVFVITVHSSEASQMLNKYFFLTIWIDLRLFTQVYEASQRRACFCVFKQVSFLIMSSYISFLRQSPHLCIWLLNSYESSSGWF